MLRRTLPILSAAFLSGLLAGCGGVDDGRPGGDFTAPVVEWQLVFSDEFDGTAIDTSKWNVDVGDGCPDLCGWGNDELQRYEADNLIVSGGTLKIEGRQDLDGSYTSGRINTKGKFDFQYGRVEVRARIPSGQGTWPAIWLLHSDPTIYGPWPLSGEIDIMEAFNYGVNGEVTQSTAHYGLPTPPFNGTSSRTDLSAAADRNFHEYALEWEKGRLRFFVDGQHFQTQIIDNWYTYYPADADGLYDEFGAYTLGLEDAPFDQAFHLLLNFAIGGNPVGAPDAGTIFPQTFEIDYVRVYECANSNVETRRGCGTADPSIEPLDDLDGGPLEGAVTAMPYREQLNLFVDGPETITLKVGEETATNMLQVSGFTGEGATVVNDPAFADPEEAGNTVWHVAVSNGVGNVYLATEDKTEDPILDSGFDFSGKGLGGDPVGEIVFRMRVNSVTDGARLLVKLDSGFLNLGEVEIPRDVLAIGEWKTYSVKFDQLLANPGFVDCCGGQGVDLENVVNPFVFEVVDGDADVYLDDIRITNACYVVGACGASPRTKGIPDLVVFDDAVNIATWDVGIAGSDSGSGFTNYTDPSNPANKANWAIIDDEDAARGKVIEVTFNDSAAFGVWFIQSTGAVDANAYAAGAVAFDLKVLDYGNNTTGMTMKIDCFFPCTSGDKNLGVVADGVWETITVPVSALTASGLDLSSVNTGIVIFPTTQSGDIVFRLDNIRWIAETDAPALSQIDLPVTFEDPTVDYTLIDFEGAGTALDVDPTDADNTVARTVKGEGAQTFAGTVIGTSAGFANPIPFTDTEKRLSVRVYSPGAGIPVMLKIENEDASVFYEVIANTTVADEWETLVFDYGAAGVDIGVDYPRAIIFFDFGQTGTGTTFLWDDVAVGDGSAPPLAGVDLPVTFDDAGVSYTFIDFNGTGTALGEDPLNMSNTVAVTTKGAGAATFAGTVIGDGSGFANPIPFTATDTTMSVKVYSPAAGIPVRLKVEAAGGSPSAEFDVLTTVANGWETLVWDFSTVGIDTSATYVQAVIFFDFGAEGNGATYYWDDVKFVPAPQVVFDDAVDPTWDVGIAATQSPDYPLITDPANPANKVNWAVVNAADVSRGQVIEVTFNDSAEFGLIFVQSSAGVDLSAYAGGSVVFDINVLDYGTNTNGMVMKIDCIFPCTSGDQPIGVVGDGDWETVTIPVSQLVGSGLNLATVNTGLVIFPDIPDQQAGGSVVFQLDNIRWEP
jgi:beta-glucanase (GH16 family)